MSAMTSQITNLTIVYSAVYAGKDQRKFQSSASLAFVKGIRRGPLNSPHKGSVRRKIIPFDDVIMSIIYAHKKIAKHHSPGEWSRAHSAMFGQWLILRNSSLSFGTETEDCFSIFAEMLCKFEVGISLVLEWDM